LLREADVAMYRAKGSGGHNLELFNEDLRREASARLELEDRLEHALPRHELLLEYQPLVKLAGGKPVGCEALVRRAPPGGGADATTGFPVAGRGERADRADWRLGAPHRLRTGRRMASRRDRDDRLGERLRA